MDEWVHDETGSYPVAAAATYYEDHLAELQAEHDEAAALSEIWLQSMDAVDDDHHHWV